MIIVDSSVIIAILDKEPGGGNLLARLKSEKEIGISAVSVLECGIVAFLRRRHAGVEDLYRFLLGNIGARIFAFDERMADMAIRAFKRHSFQSAAQFRRLRKLCAGQAA